MTLIPADDHFALMAALFVIAGTSLLAERTRIGTFAGTALFQVPG